VGVIYDKSYHLPGDIATVYMEVENSTTGAPQMGVTQLFVSGCYYGKAAPAVCANIGSTLGSYPTPLNLTSEQFTVPPDAEPGTQLHVVVEANVTIDGLTYSENSTSTALNIATPDAPTACVTSTVGDISTSCAPPCTIAEFCSILSPGESFLLQVNTLVTEDGASAPWANANVSINYYMNGDLSSSKTFDSNGQGVAGVTVQTLGLGSGNLTIIIGVTDPLNYALTASQTIKVELKPTPSVNVQVTLNAGEYFGGDSLTASYVLTTYSGTSPSGWMANSYMIVAFSPGTACGIGSISSTSPDYQMLSAGNLAPATHGTVVSSYTLPLTLQGTVDVAVYANNATASAYGEACALVTPPSLIIQPSETTYNPGDTISVSLYPQGSVFNGASYYAEVSNGASTGTVVIYNSSLGSSTSFSFKIPAAGTLPNYYLTVVAQTGQGIISGQDVKLTEYSGYALEVSVQTASQYSDGSFQPGQSISFGYTVTSLGLAKQPKVFQMLAWFVNTAQGQTTYNEVSSTGSFSMSIPSSAGTGVMIAEFEAAVPTASGTVTVTTVVGLLVNPSPSFLDYKPFGSSFGMTTGQLILLIILVIVALILIFIMLRRGGGGGSYQAKPKRHLFRRGKGMDQWSTQQAPPPQGQPQDAAPPPEGGAMPYQQPPPPAEGGWPPPAPQDAPAQYTPPPQP
jgi:hypothetical protein